MYHILYLIDKYDLADKVALLQLTESCSRPKSVDM